MSLYACQEESTLPSPHRSILNILRRELRDRTVPYLLLGTFVLLYLHLFIFPFVPILSWNDQSVYAGNARRMLEGQVIYRDFFQFTPPGTELVYFALFKLLGPRGWIPSAVLILLGLGLTWLSLAISRKVLSHWAALLSALLFLIVAFRSGLNATHHWYSTLAAVGGVAAVITKRSPGRMAVAGALCGLALCFTQVRGFAVIGLAVFLLWERRRKNWTWRLLLQLEGCLVASFLATVMVFNAYFAWKAGVGRFLACTVVFGARYYRAIKEVNSLEIYMVPAPQVRAWYDLPRLFIYVFIHALVPLVYVLFLVRYRREAQARPQEPWDRLMLLNLVGLSLFIGVAPSPSAFRLCAVALPAFILFVWLIGSPGRIQRVLTGCLWAFVLILPVASALKTQKSRRAYLDLPSGRTAFLDPAWYDRCKWVFDHTQPLDFFFDGSGGVFYFVLGLRNPTPVPFLTPTDYTRPEQVHDIVVGLERHRVHYVLWPSWLDYGDTLYPSHDHLGPLRVYIHAHYHVVKTFWAYDYDQVWERNE